jgi:nucleoside phosphorylase
MEKAPKILILAAWPPELARIRRVFRTAPYRKWLGQIQLETVGVGLVEAAIGTAAAISRHQPQLVILVGTAGAFPSAKLNLKAAAVVSRTTLGSPEIDSVAQLPAPMPREAWTSTRFSADLAKHTALETAAVVCPLAITRSGRRAKQLEAASGAQLENLEAFAVAQAAQRAKVPFVAVLGVANVVGPMGAKQWRDHGQDAAANACLAVAHWLKDERVWKKLLQRS